VTRAKKPKAAPKKRRAPRRAAARNTQRGAAARIEQKGAQARRAPKVAGAASADAGFERVCKIAMKFPGMEVSTSYGTPALKVKGKFMARLRSEAEGGLAIRCDFVDRQMLLAAAPEVFFLTDHYRDYPMILVRLDEVRADALPDLIERAWRMTAPKKLIDAYDAAR
jgi:hypothetical protein